ncbi:MAG: LysR family transcriptional regulator, low CO2-responsive transcriptional regulator [Gammaproteobacteria bacterium]|nr:LysR family transcriptional regulator, low CO2-responsive transcriptional regulator [Gammaproteobacteria bacterium]
MSIQHVSLRQLRVFEAAATNRSFSKAAEYLHLTQPGVSMHIKELETSAGLPLFERIGRKLYVTEAGQELLARAREILRALKDAEDTLDSLRGLRRGRINLAVVSTAKYFVPQLLARFGKNFPELEIRLAVSNRNSVIEQLVANEVDLAIMGRSPQALDTVAEPFAQNPHVIIAAPDHPLAAQHGIPVETVAQENFIVREPGSGTRLAMQQFFEEFGLACNVGMEMASNETIKQAVMAGMGVSFISRHTTELEIQTRRLVVLDVRGTPVIRQWHVAHLAKKRLSPTAVAFKEFVLTQGRELLRDRGTAA